MAHRQHLIQKKSSGQTFSPNAPQKQSSRVCQKESRFFLLKRVISNYLLLLRGGSDSQSRLSGKFQLAEESSEGGWLFVRAVD
jgi:hypothetical protein